MTASDISPDPDPSLSLPSDDTDERLTDDSSEVADEAVEDAEGKGEEAGSADEQLGSGLTLPLRRCAACRLPRTTLGEGAPPPLAPDGEDEMAVSQSGARAVDNGIGARPLRSASRSPSGSIGRSGGAAEDFLFLRKATRTGV